MFLSYDPDTKFVRYQTGGTGSAGSNGTSGTSGSNGSAGERGSSGSNGSSGSSGVSGDVLWTSGTTLGSVVGVVGSNTNTAEYALVVGKDNTSSNSQPDIPGGSIIIGSGNTFNAVIGQVFGLKNSADSLYPFIVGNNNINTLGNTNAIFGSANTISAGTLNFIGGSQSSTIGKGSLVSRSAIIGGQSNVLEGTALTRSVILGGQGITGNSSNMVYVPNLTIVSATTGTAVNFIGIDSNNKLITVSGGANGTSGSSGSSGANGTSGTSGSAGERGSSGVDGTSGSSGSSGANGTSGTSFASPYIGNVQITSGQTWVTLPSTGTTTSATTINFNNGNVQEVVLGDNTTFTFSNPNAGATYILVVRQSSGGSNTVTWPGTVTWAGGTTPTMTATANKFDVYTFIYDGSRYFASYVQNFT